MTSAVLASARGVPAPRPRRRPPVLGDDVSRGASRSAPPPIPPSPSLLPPRSLDASPSPASSPRSPSRDDPPRARRPTPDPRPPRRRRRSRAPRRPRARPGSGDRRVGRGGPPRGSRPNPTDAHRRFVARRPRGRPRRAPPLARGGTRLRRRRRRARLLRRVGVVPSRRRRAALAYDCRGLALGAAGDWNAAVDASRRALAAAGSAGLAREGLDVPTTAPAAGLIGGAPTVAQRLAFHAAMARWGAGDVAAAAAALDRLDVGPEPEPGFPQFWEARAALAAALWASGAKPRAEAEWAALCRGAKPNPPAVPTNGVKAAVNKAAQMQFDGYGVLMDKRCEDFSTGTPLPCDDAGIPGAGGAARRVGSSRRRRRGIGFGRPRRPTRSRGSSGTGRSTSCARRRWRGGEEENEVEGEMRTGSHHFIRHPLPSPSRSVGRDASQQLG